MGTVKAFTNDGLFIGQSAEFFAVITGLAQGADAARRSRSVSGRGGAARSAFSCPGLSEDFAALLAGILAEDECDGLPSDHIAVASPSVLGAEPPN